MKKFNVSMYLGFKVFVLAVFASFHQSFSNVEVLVRSFAENG